jgi:predicted RNase H-like nuclease (RuvC/YqgF family)
MKSCYKWEEEMKKLSLKWCDEHGYMPSSYKYCHYCGEYLKNVEQNENDKLLQRENTKLKKEIEQLKEVIDELKDEIDSLKYVDIEDEFEDDEILL